MEALRLYYALSILRNTQQYNVEMRRILDSGEKGEQPNNNVTVLYCLYEKGSKYRGLAEQSIQINAEIENWQKSIEIGQ